MKQITIDTSKFDGDLFMEEYSVGESDFFISGDLGNILNYPDHLPDVPNIIPSLAALKARKCKEIDSKTASLISQGFSYSNKQFSLSVPAQINWSYVHDNPTLLSYPYTVSTIDDLDEYSIADWSDAVAMADAAAGTKEGWVTSGTALKSQVRAATTQAELDNVIDGR